MSIEGNVAKREELKRQIAKGVAYALAPVVRALSGCPVPEFSKDPYGTIRTVLSDMEDLAKTGRPADQLVPPVEVVTTGRMEADRG